MGDTLPRFVDYPGSDNYPGWRLSGVWALSRLHNDPGCRERPLFGDCLGSGDCEPSRAGLASQAQAVRSQGGPGEMGPQGNHGQRAHKAIAAVAEGGLAEGDLLEGVQEAQAQFGADGAGSEQVPCQLLSAEGAPPGVRWGRPGFSRPGPFLPDLGVPATPVPRLQGTQKSRAPTPGRRAGEAHGRRRGSCLRVAPSPPERWCLGLQGHNS